MRIGRYTLSIDFLAKIIKTFLRQLPQQESIGIKTGRRVSLREYQIPAMAIAGGMPEMIVAYVVECRSRRKAGDMAANIGVFVGAQHHRHGVPSHIGTNTMLQRMITG